MDLQSELDELKAKRARQLQARALRLKELREIEERKIKV